MLTSKRQHAVPVLVFLLLLTGGIVDWPFAGPRADAAEPQDSKLKILLKERLAVLKEIAAQTEKAAKSGEVPFERVLRASEAVLKAELDLAESDKQRIAVFEKMVALAKQREEQAVNVVKMGQAPANLVLQAKVSRLEAEIALERAKSK